MPSTVISHCLPCAGTHCDVFSNEMIGARISAIGTLPACGSDNLIIEYIPTGRRRPVRLVLGYSDIGMWIVNKFVKVGDSWRVV
jgi:hypothetical protein